MCGVTYVGRKNGSVVFKVVVLEGKVPETVEAASLFIDIVMTGSGPGT